MSVFSDSLPARALTRRLPAGPRVVSVDAIAVLLLLVCAAVLAVVAPAAPGSFAELAAGVALYAVARRVTFTVGSGTSSALPLVFVPMWFVASPAALVLVAIAGQLAAWLLGVARSGGLRTVRVRDGVSEAAGAWHALGPAVLMAVLGSPAPSLEFMPLLLVGAAIQLAIYLVAMRVRDLAAGTTLRPMALRDIAGNATVDLSLAPTGLILAWVRDGSLWPMVLVLPLMAVLARFAGERERGVAHANQLAAAYRGTAALMGDVLEADDEYTGGEHTNGVVAMATRVGEALGLSERRMQHLELGALLHDIGKLRIPNEVINKPGKLTDEEWVLIKQHPAHGEEMLMQVGGLLAEVAPIVRAHHERFDGGGYPDGLAGEAIPIEARVITVCDSYSAMTTDRSYRKAMSHADAIEELERCTPGQFDAAVVSALMTAMASGQQERLRIVPAVRASSSSPTKDAASVRAAGAARPAASVPTAHAA